MLLHEMGVWQTATALAIRQSAAADVDEAAVTKQLWRDGRVPFSPD